MAKRKEREVAKKLFVDQHMNQKDIAAQLDVTEKTVGVWVRKYNWLTIRDAKLNNSKNRSENIKKVIEELTNMTLKNIEQIKQAEVDGETDRILTLKKETTRISQEVAMYQKALEKMDKDYKISLSTYIDVMENIFEELSRWNQKVFLKTIDFQKEHLQSIADKLG